MYCIKCGNKLTEYIDNEQQSGYICLNQNCIIYNTSWKITDHKDNQEWAVRHIRALEAKISELENRIKELEM
jgi:hypothetical protein